MREPRLRPSAAAESGAEPSVLGLSFVERYRFRPFEVVAPGFLHDHRLAVGPVTTLVHSEVAPPAPFTAVEVEVERLDGVLVAGLGSPGGDQVVATYDPRRRRLSVEVDAGGSVRAVRRRAVLRPPYTLGFALCENQVTVLVTTRRRGWRPLLTCRTEVAALLDLRRPATLARLRSTWGVRSGTATLGAVRAGLFGMTGLRDPHVVQHADGRPLVRDGKAYLTWTCAGLGSFRAAHWGVFTLDLADPTRLEQVAQIFTLRDGLLLGDHAGQLVRHGDRWLVLTSSWGDFDDAGEGPLRNGVHVRHAATTADLLTGVHVLETRPTDLPTDVGAWDPGLTRVDGLWLLSFVESPSQRPFDFHPALASTADDSPWTGLGRVGAAADLQHCEGTLLTRVEEGWRLLASDGAARCYPVFDLQMRRVGELAAPYLTNIPHPQLLARGDGSWLMVSFDGTGYGGRRMGYGGHGDVVVMAARPT